MARYDDDDDDDRADDEEDGRPIKKKRKRGNPMEGGFVGFLLFRKMIGDWILVVLYWLLVLACIGGGLFFIVMAFVGMRQMGAIALLGVVYGLLIILIYPIVLRVYFELAIIVYRIHEAVNEIRDNTR
jgi:uncharacterized protein DUF4282